MVGGIGVSWDISQQPWGIESIPAGGLGLKRMSEELGSQACSRDGTVLEAQSPSLQIAP